MSPRYNEPPQWVPPWRSQVKSRPLQQIPRYHEPFARVQKVLLYPGFTVLLTDCKPACTWPVPKLLAGEPPFSTDANLLHISYEGNALEDPWSEAPDDMWTRSVAPEAAPNTATYVEIEFEQGNPVAINGVRMSPAVLLTRLNELGGANGTLLHQVIAAVCGVWACRGQNVRPRILPVWHWLCIDRA